MIIDGKIKLKHGTNIERFTKKGLVFDDGSELDADVVVFATGYGLVVDLTSICTDPLQLWRYTRERARHP